MAVYRDPDGRFALAATDRRVELWTVERIPFETDQEEYEKEMVAEYVAPAIRRIAWRDGEVMHAIFVSDERGARQPDAENITFYNFGDKPFGLAPNWIRFERSYSPAPPCPAELSEPPRYYHVWEPASPQGGFRCWKGQETDPLAKWSGVDCWDVTGEKGGQEVWLALRRAKNVKIFERSYRNENFGVESVLRLPPQVTARAVRVIKAIVDGSIAGFQHFPEADRSRAEEVAEQLAQKLHGGGSRPTAAELLHHLTAADRTIFPRPPFNKAGRAQLNSYDEPCVVGEVRIIVDERVSAPTPSASIFLVEPTDSNESGRNSGGQR